MAFGVVMGLTIPFIYTTFARSPYQIPTPVPETFLELQSVTGQNFVTQSGAIADYLKQIQCGGWEKKESVGGKIARILKDDGGGVVPESSVDMPTPPIPGEKDIPLVQLPKMLGYPLAPVAGLPGRKGEWSGNIKSGMAAREDGNFKYPKGAEGYAFAYDTQNSWCTWLPDAFFNIPQTFCSTEKGCLKSSDIINNEWRHPVCRITECWAGMYAYACEIKWTWIVDDEETGEGHWEQGIKEETCDAWLYAWDVYVPEDTEATLNGSIVHTQAECNSCPVLDGYAEVRWIVDDEETGEGHWEQERLLPNFTPCPQWNGWVTFGCAMNQALPKVGGYVGEKFTCTADAEETFTPAIWTEPWYDDSDPPNRYYYNAICPNANGDAATNTRKLLSPHGWVWMDESHSGIVNMPQQCEQYLIKENTEYPNITTCGVEDHINLVGAGKYTKDNGSTSGEECSCYAEGIDPNTGELQWSDECRADERTSPKNGAYYLSFFRRYKAKYSRDPLPVPPIVRTNKDPSAASSSSAKAEITEKEGEFACYGWYREFDTLEHMPDSSDWRCVIDIIGKKEIDASGKVTIETFREQMLKSHMLRGEYGQNSSFVDRYPSLNSQQRFGGTPRARGAFDEDKDNWYLKLGGGFSFINEKLFDKTNKDLTHALFMPDIAEMRNEADSASSASSSPRVSSAQREQYVRAFDDAVTNNTGDLRPIVEWWQEQQTKANILFSPPTVRLLLPANWAASIDPLDPLFTPTRMNPSNTLTRTDALEVQLRAHEDLIGEVAAYIERSVLLNIEQEPVPIVVPMGSPTELRAIAEGWCAWWIGYSNRSIPDAQADSRINTCDGAPTEILALIQKLELYAERIEDVRGLRGELAYYLTRLLEIQLGIVTPITEWIKQNLTTYKDFFDRRQQIFDELLPVWQFTQYIYQQFHDNMNFPWCMNQRFTIPIYSLIDPFIPVRENRIERVNGFLDYSCPFSGQIEWPFCLPVLHGIHISTDFVFDFSMMSITADDKIVIPILSPIQVKLDIAKLRPPSVETLPGTVPILADLPSIPDIQTVMRQALNSAPLQNVLVAGTPPTIIPPPLITDNMPIQTLWRDLVQMLYMVYAMTYGTEEGTGGLPGYEDFWSSLVHKEDKKTGEIPFFCPSWTSWPCIHVEMDLLERFTRIGARPAVLLKEDYDSRGKPREDPFTCPPNDHVCLFLNTQARFPKEGWKVNVPASQQDFIDGVRTDIRMITLPKPIGGVSSSAMPLYEATPSDLLESMKVVPRVDLRPTLPPTP